MAPLRARISLPQSQNTLAGTGWLHPRVFRGCRQRSQEGISASWQPLGREQKVRERYRGRAHPWGVRWGSWSRCGTRKLCPSSRGWPKGGSGCAQGSGHTLDPFHGRRGGCSGALFDLRLLGSNIAQSRVISEWERIK